jgi:hypothetical protein
MAGLGADDDAGLSPAAIMRHSGNIGHHGSPEIKSGLLTHPTAGRTDRLPMDLPSGSYVLPADVVSGLAEGNTLAGARVLDMMFSTNPYGIKTKGPAGGGVGIPHAGDPTHPFTGGAEYNKRGGQTHKVKVIVAGGEYLATPENVAKLGGYPDIQPDFQKALNHGHDVLDHFVLHIRKHNVNETRKLPPPKK